MHTVRSRASAAATTFRLVSGVAPDVGPMCFLTCSISPWWLMRSLSHSTPAASRTPQWWRPLLSPSVAARARSHASRSAASGSCSPTHTLALAPLVSDAAGVEDAVELELSASPMIKDPSSGSDELPGWDSSSSSTSISVVVVAAVGPAPAPSAPMG